MSEPFLGQISIFSFGFAPKGWTMCNGQLLSIAQNQALFALLGTQFGGNGIQTFGLPNLQGNVPMGMGNGAGLTPRVIGQSGGEQGVTLTVSQIPSHSHVPNYTAMADAAGQNTVGPVGKLWAPDPNGNVTFSTGDGEMLAANALANTGGSLPHNNMAPYLVLNFCIALVGIFPSRN